MRTIIVILILALAAPLAAADFSLWYAKEYLPRLEYHFFHNHRIVDDEWIGRKYMVNDRHTWPEGSHRWWELNINYPVTFFRHPDEGRMGKMWPKLELKLRKELESFSNMGYTVIPKSKIEAGYGFRDAEADFKEKHWNFGYESHNDIDPTDHPLYRPFALMNITSKSSTRPKASFFDDHNGVAFTNNRRAYMAAEQNGGRESWLMPPDWSIAHPEKFPERYRIWGGPARKDRTLGYVGMADDDVLYDFRKENPFDTVLTHNAEGMFIYVYDFDTVRERLSEWQLHDRILYGIYEDSDEDNGIFHDRHAEKYPGRLAEPRDLVNKARIFYPPLLDDPNDEYLRMLRAVIFTKLYLAKLRLASLVIPAPEWDDRIGDWKVQSSRNGVSESDVKYRGDIDHYADPLRYPDFGKARDAYIKNVLKLSGYEYWQGVMSENIRYNNHYHRVLEEYFNNPTPGLLYQARVEARTFLLNEAFRDLYYAMSYKVPNDKDVARLASRYWQKGHFNRSGTINAGIYSGCTGAGSTQFAHYQGPKTFYPFWEGKQRPGHLWDYGKKLEVRGVRSYGRFSRYKYERVWNIEPVPGHAAFDIYPIEEMVDLSKHPTNTGGLMYGGSATPEQLEQVRGEISTNTGREMSADDAPRRMILRGPFMIVSSRTYQRKGHAYFEQLAGHTLVHADVTGAVLDSLSRVRLIPDPAYLAQIKDMDYFYVKSDETSRLGRATMYPASEVKAPRLAVGAHPTPLWAKTWHPAAVMDEGSSTRERSEKAERTALLEYKIPRQAFRRLSREIAAAHAADKRDYPDLQMHRANWLPNMYVRHDKQRAKGEKLIGLDNPRHPWPEGLEFLGYIKIMKDERLVENLGVTGKALHRKLMSEVLPARIPFLTGSPHLFLCYYDNIDALMPVFNCEYEAAMADVKSPEGPRVKLLHHKYTPKIVALHQTRRAIATNITYATVSYYGASIRPDRRSYASAASLLGMVKGKERKWLNSYVTHFDPIGIATGPAHAIHGTLRQNTEFADGKKRINFYEAGGAYGMQCHTDGLSENFAYLTREPLWNPVTGLSYGLQAPQGAAPYYDGEPLVFDALFPEMFRYLDKTPSITTTCATPYFPFTRRQWFWASANRNTLTEIRTYEEWELLTRTYLAMHSTPQSNVQQLHRAVQQVRNLRTHLMTEGHAFVVETGLPTSAVDSTTCQVSDLFEKLDVVGPVPASP